MGLSRDQKVWIIKALAGFLSPKETADAFAKEFGVVVSRQTVDYYTPRASSRLGKEWRDIFARLREEYLEDLSQIPIASEAYRLRRLQQLHVQASEAGFRPEAAEYLAQAAKERGGSFTNSRRFMGTAADGRNTPLLPVFPIVVGPGLEPPADFVDPTIDE